MTFTAFYHEKPHQTIIEKGDTGDMRYYPKASYSPMKDMTYILYLWQKLQHYHSIKIAAALAFAILAYFFDPLEATALVALFALILLDFVYGVAAAKKTGLPITSAKIRRSAIKMAVYFSLIAAAHISEYAIPAQIGFLDETVTAFLVATELISIMENVGRLGFAIPMRLLNQLQNYTDKGTME